jgi:16S rRNA processing protein RimM
MTTPAFIIVGRVRKAHGIRGEVVVEPITDVPDVIFASGHRVFAGTASGDIAPNRAELHVESSRPFSDGYLIAFAEVPDRNAAETWRGR